MSRSPLRDLFRLVHSGLEKVALACAAFGLMHATARAGESVPASVPAGEPWSGHVAPQPVADDPWSNPAAPALAIDDAWSAPSRQVVAALAPHVETQEPQPAALKSAPRAEADAVQKAPRALVMDHSDWNETPRGRSPGLIASHDAWLKRITPVAVPTEAPKTLKAPNTPLRNVPSAVVDPWSAQWIGLVASNEVPTPPAALSSPAFDTHSRPGIVASADTALTRVDEAQGVSPSEASTTVLAASRPMHRRTRPVLQSTANAPRSSGSSGMKRARATKSARAALRAGCRSVSASARYR